MGPLLPKLIQWWGWPSYMQPPDRCTTGQDSGSDPRVCGLSLEPLYIGVCVTQDQSPAERMNVASPAAWVAPAILPRSLAPELLGGLQWLSRKGTTIRGQSSVDTTGAVLTQGAELGDVCRAHPRRVV